jgi:ribosomal protein L37E
MGAFQAMATMLTGVLAESRSNQTEMTKMLMETLARQQQPPSDPLRDQIMSIGLTAMTSRPDPDEELERHLKVAERLGYKRPDPSGNVVDLSLVRARHEMTIAERRLELEQRRMDAELAREDRTADRELKVAEERARALTEGIKAFGVAVGSRGKPDGQQATPTPARLVRYRCNRCGVESGVPDGVPPKFCAACGYTGEEDGGSADA